MFSIFFFEPLDNILTLKKYFQNVAHFCLEHFVFPIHINDYFLPLPASSSLYFGIVSLAVNVWPGICALWLESTGKLFFHLIVLCINLKIH